ncbi:MAG: outer membrane lipoprotein carrier protein LolA [Prevotellaceae bacterium]|jgi:outer membrane lipoprotein-sorting protein|nr:outer membrane lipoprotein carrier protein LolA [Prevotellaceae bacterium]
MKKILLLIGICLSAGVWAQQAQYTPDKEAKSILDKTAAALQKTSGVQASFTLTIDNHQMDKKQSLNGTIWLKGNKFKLSVAEMETCYDGKTQWVYLPDNEEVTISAPTAEELQDVNPTAIISSYQKGYKLQKSDDKTIDGKPAFVVSLYPDERTQPYHRIEITVEKSTYNILAINTFGKNGTDTLIKIKKYTKDLTLADNLFIFDTKKYPEVEIVDLR